jgi:hypothetical protein
VHAQFLADLRGALRIDVVDPHQGGAQDVAEDPGVVEAEAPDPHHPDGERRRAHTDTPRSVRSKKARKLSTSGIARSSSRARASAWVVLCPDEKNSR